METYELMELMKDVGEHLDDRALQKIDDFLVFSCGIYEQMGENQAMIHHIGWTSLNTPHLLEEFGTNCRQMNMALKRIEQEKGYSQIGNEFREIRHFLGDEKFQLFCHRSLEELEGKAQYLLGEGPDLTPSRTSREIESGRESFEDMKKLYQETKTLQENAKKYAEAADELQKQTEQLQRRTEQFKLDALNAQHAAESVIPNMLTALGVFVAIVVAVVSCYLSLIFNKHQNPDFPVLNLSVCLLMGHILMNVIFLLMYLISKLTNYTMACHCHIVSQADCSICPMEVRQKCRLPNRIWLRYPYVILLNGVFPVGYLALVLWSLLRHYLGSEIDQLLFDNPVLVLISAIALVALFAYVLWKIHCLLRPSDELHCAAANLTKSQDPSQEKGGNEEGDAKPSDLGVH